MIRVALPEWLTGGPESGGILGRSVFCRRVMVAAEVRARNIPGGGETDPQDPWDERGETQAESGGGVAKRVCQPVNVPCLGTGSVCRNKRLFPSGVGLAEAEGDLRRLSTHPVSDVSTVATAPPWNRPAGAEMPGGRGGQAKPEGSVDSISPRRWILEFHLRLTRFQAQWRSSESVPPRGEAGWGSHLLGRNQKMIFSEHRAFALKTFCRSTSFKGKWGVSPSQTSEFPETHPFFSGGTTASSQSQ